MKLGHLFLLLALGLAIPPNYREEFAFLQSAGLEDMIDVFHGEEIELDNDLKQKFPHTFLDVHFFRVLINHQTSPTPKE